MVASRKDKKSRQHVSTCIKDAGIAVRHPQCIISTLQAPEMGWKVGHRCPKPQKPSVLDKCASKKHSMREIQYQGEAKVLGPVPRPKNEINVSKCRFRPVRLILLYILPPSVWEAVTKSAASAASLEGFPSSNPIGR